MPYGLTCEPLERYVDLNLPPAWALTVPTWGGGAPTFQDHVPSDRDGVPDPPARTIAAIQRLIAAD